MPSSAWKKKERPNDGRPGESVLRVDAPGASPRRPAPFRVRRRTGTGSATRPSQHGRSVLFFNDTATTEIYTLSLHDALPIWYRVKVRGPVNVRFPARTGWV